MKISTVGNISVGHDLQVVGNRQFDNHLNCSGKRFFTDTTYVNNETIYRASYVHSKAYLSK